jgi:hypothetical protein
MTTNYVYIYIHIHTTVTRMETRMMQSSIGHDDHSERENDPFRQRTEEEERNGRVGAMGSTSYRERVASRLAPMVERRFCLHEKAGRACELAVRCDAFGLGCWAVKACFLLIYVLLFLLPVAVVSWAWIGLLLTASSPTAQPALLRCF